MTFGYGLLAAFVLIIYSVIITFTFMSDNPNDPELTWKNLAKRAIAVPFWIGVAIGVIYGLGIVTEFVIGVAS